MDSSTGILHDLINNDSYKTLPLFLDRLDFLLTRVFGVNNNRIDVIEEFIKEISTFQHPKVSLYFGKTWRDLKCVILDNSERQHEIWVQYMGPKRLRILNIDVPPSYIQNHDYPTVKEAIEAFIKHVDTLKNYFIELEKIDLHCTVLEPNRPSFKENYRKIRLGSRISLQVEVAPDGSAENLHILDMHKVYGNKPRELLQDWDHGMDIPTNVTKIVNSLDSENIVTETNITEEVNEGADPPCCAICLCIELPNVSSRPVEGLCNNPSCGIYLHKECLNLYLKYDNSHISPFGIISGVCPRCNQRIQSY